MKLVIAIVSNKDNENVMASVAQAGYFATKISTHGQFLVDGHNALLICCEEDMVQPLFELIKNNVTKRTIKTAGVTSTVDGSLLNQAVDVEENGAVAFVINVEDFKKF